MAKLEKAVSDLSLAAEDLLSLIHIHFLQPLTREKNLTASSRGPYFDEIKTLAQALGMLAGSLHSLQLHINFALPPALSQAGSLDEIPENDGTSKTATKVNIGISSLSKGYMAETSTDFNHNTLERWADRFKGVYAILSATASSSGPASADGKLLILEWPLSLDKTKEICREAHIAKNTIDEFYLKTESRASLQRILSTPDAGFDHTKPQIVGRFFDPETSTKATEDDKCFHKASKEQIHPLQSKIRSTAILWMQQIEDDCEVTAPQLCEALAVHFSVEAKSLGDLRLLTEHQLFDICNDFLLINHGGLLSLADQRGEVGKDMSSLAMVCLRMLSFPEFGHPLEEAIVQESYRSERNRQHPLYPFAAKHLLHVLRRSVSTDNEDIIQALKELFQPGRTLNLLQYLLEFSRQQYSGHFESFGSVKIPVVKEYIALLTNPTLSPFHIAACLGLPHVCEDRLRASEHVDRVSGLGTPLFCALAGPSAVLSCSLWAGSSKMAEAPLGLDQKGTIKVIQRALGPDTESAAVGEDSFLAVCLYASALHQDLELFTSMAAANVQRHHLRDLRFVLEGPEFRKMMASRADIDELRLSTREYVAELCAFLFDLCVIQEDYDEVEAYRSLEEATWALASLWSLWLCDPGSNRPITRLSDSEYILKTEAIASSDKINKRLITRLIQDPRWPSSMMGLRDTVFGSNKQTLLHKAVEDESCEIAELLLEHGGADVSSKDDAGLQPIHLCQDRAVLTALVRYGADLHARDNEGRTIWHNAAANNDELLLLALLEIDPDKHYALKMQNQYGRTPVAEAFLYVRELAGVEKGMMEDEMNVTASIRLLMQQASGKREYYASDTSLLHLTAEWGLAALLLSLLEADYELQAESTLVGGATPMHFLNFGASEDFVRLLLEVRTRMESRSSTPWPVLDSEGRSAAETIFLNFRPKGTCGNANSHPSNDKPLDGRAFAALLEKEVIQSRSQNGSTLWERFCKNVVEFNATDGTRWYSLVSSITLALGHLLDRGAVAYHEEVGQTPALLLFLVAMKSAMNGWRKKLTVEAGLPSILIRLIKETKDFNAVKDDSNVVHVLSWATTIKNPRPDGNDPERPVRSELIAILLEKGVSVHAPAGSFSSAMEAACLPGECSFQDFAMILNQADKKLLNHRLPIPTDKTPLELLCLESRGAGLRVREKETKLKALVNAGADPNTRTKAGEPLSVACICSDESDAARWLLQAGAQWHDATENGFNVVLTAALLGEQDLLLWIRDQNPEFLWTASCTIEHRIRAASQNKTMHSISGCTGLHLAALNGNMGILKFFLRNRLLDVNCVCPDRRLTPMHFAAVAGHMECIEYLASQGADVMARDVNGATPLFYAVWGRQPGGVRKLLELGAVARHLDFEYNTLLSEAVKDGHPEVKQLLFAAVREEAVEESS